MMNKCKLWGIFSLGVIAVTAPSCASIVSRSKYDVTFNSNPSQATVRVLNRRGVEIASGQTPASFRLRAKDGFFKPAKYTVVFSKEGYEEKMMPLKAEFDAWVVGNLIIGGPLGIIIDGATGAMWRIDDDMFNVSLQKKPQPMASIKDTKTGQEVSVYALADVPEEWQKRMTKIK